MSEASTSKDDTDTTKGKKKYTPIYPAAFYQGKEAEKWTLDEKVKLLEGLKRYNEQSENISHWLETKTPEEVERMIAEVKGRKYGDPGTYVDSESDQAAPIDKWLRLVNEITFFEHSNQSEYLSMVFGLIARNEEFAPGGHPHLDWRRIYQYIAALLSDSRSLPELSDIESAVILDLMNNIGDSLQKVDTTQQRHILDWKYQLLYNQRESRSQMNHFRTSQALNNDFESPEDQTPGASTSGLKTSNTEPSMIVSSDASTSRTEPENISTTDTNPEQPPASSSDDIETVNTQPNASKVDTTQRENSGVVGNDGNSSVVGNDGNSEVVGGVQETDEVVRDEEEDNDESGSETLDNSEGYPKVKFEKPKYFTLNPLCIPASLMPIKRRKVEPS